LSRGMPSQRSSMSAIESIATPAIPTSPATRGWSESYLENRGCIFSSISYTPLIINCSPAMSGKVEGNTHTLLASSEILLIKSVRFLWGTCSMSVIASILHKVYSFCLRRNTQLKVVVREPQLSRSQRTGGSSRAGCSTSWHKAHECKGRHRAHLRGRGVECQPTCTMAGPRVAESL